MNTIPNLGAYGYVAPVPAPVSTQKGSTLLYVLLGTFVLALIAFVVYLIVDSTKKNDQSDHSSLPTQSKNFGYWIGNDLRKRF